VRVFFLIWAAARAAMCCGGRRSSTEPATGAALSGSACAERDGCCSGRGWADYETGPL